MLVEAETFFCLASLIFFCAPARGTQQANVREQRLVNDRTSATARRQFQTFIRVWPETDPEERSFCLDFCRGLDI